MKIIPALFVISFLTVCNGCIVVFIRGLAQGWGNILVAIPIAGIAWMLLNALLIGVLYLVGLKRVERRFNPMNVAFLSVAVSCVSGVACYYL